MTLELFIRLEGEPRAIVIVDDRGIQGGDLKIRTGDEVKWTNETGRACKLKFRELRLGPSPGYGGRVWPFRDADPGGDLEIPSTGWCGTVQPPDDSRGKNAYYAKYDVKVTGGGPPLDLDPIIIIDK